MLKSLLPVLLLTAAFVSADAKTYKLPDEDSAAASITLPEDWDQEDVENGIGGTSADGAVYISAVVVSSEKGMNAEIDDTFAMLKEHKVELDEKSKKEQKFEINGLEASEMIFQGKDEDGPASISITFVPLKDKVMVLTYWVSSEDEKKHQEEVGKIVKSIKPVS